MNKKDAKVTIVKDAQPDAAQDFDYTTTGAAGAASRSTMTLTRRCRARTHVHDLGRRLRFEDGHGVRGRRLGEHEPGLL